MRVLIVDDELLARTALAQILSARPDVERFDSAGDAFEAQEHLAHENYDVMLLDIRMPELSGLELLGDLQQSGRSLPSVVLVTAFAQHAVAAFEKHAVDYILKPFSSQRVNQALEFASRRTASERAARLLELMPHLGEFSPQLSSKIAIKSNGRILFVGRATWFPCRRKEIMSCCNARQVLTCYANRFLLSRKSSSPTDLCVFTARCW